MNLQTLWRYRPVYSLPWSRGEASSLLDINKRVTNTETYGCVLAGASEC